MMRYSDPAGRMGATGDFSDPGRNGAVVYSKILRPGGAGAAAHDEFDQPP